MMVILPGSWGWGASGGSSGSSLTGHDDFDLNAKEQKSVKEIDELEIILLKVENHM